MTFSSEQSKQLYYSLPNKIAQSDLLRMEILKKFGGVYVDIDTEPFEPIDFLVHSFDFFCLLYGPTYGNLFIDTYFIGAIQNHPVINQVIDNIISFFSNPPDLSSFIKSDHILPNLMTSIIPLTRAVYQCAGRGNTRDVILPVKYFDNHFTCIFSYGNHYPTREWKK